jgi:osmotically-inducible protein OsmY
MQSSISRGQAANKNMRLITSSISAVIGGILLLGGMAGCSLFQALHQCGIAECPADAKITAAVEGRFQELPSTERPNRISVSTFDGVVYLGGAVESPSAEAAAELIARETPGVTAVVSSIVGRQTE